MRTAQNIQNGAARTTEKVMAKNNNSICDKSKKVVKGTVHLDEDNNGISLTKIATIEAM